MQGIVIDKEKHFVGHGKERDCYAHPEKPEIAVKINHSKENKQTRREIGFYRSLRWRKKLSFERIPRYYGRINTNLGPGHMFDLIRDYNGEVSKSLLWYLESGLALDQFEEDLDKLKEYFLEQELIFNHDMYAGNLLFKKDSETDGKLVVIDGLGDTVFIKFLNMFSTHRISKIERRWELFINRLRKRAAKMQASR